MIVHELMDLVKQRAKNKEVVDFRVGLSYVGVLLNDGCMGLAYVFRNELKPTCETLSKSLNPPINALQMVKLAASIDSLESSLGVATINALIEVREEECLKGDIMEVLDVKKDDKVCMIGFISPIFSSLKGKVKEIFVIERKAINEPHVFPDWAAELLLPKADVVIISGTTVVNKTVDHLLELSKGARDIALVGPTTPLAPDVFSKHGVTILSGIIVTNPVRALDVISRGGGTPSLKEAVEKVNLLCRKRSKS